MKKFLVVIIFIPLFYFSCKKETLDYKLFGKEYFPLKVGYYIIYSVDSIQFYDITLTSDTFRYQLMELVDSTITDDFGNTSFMIKRFVRANDLQPWTLKRVWLANLYNDRAEKQEENLRFMKLHFPVILNKTWRGNIYIVADSVHHYKPDWNYIYKTMDTTLQMNGNKLDSCIVVQQYNEQNQIEKHIEREMYQKGTGLVYKELIQVGRQTIDPLNWKPEKGRIVIYRFLEKNY
jgi:hypothetical protein